MDAVVDTDVGLGHQHAARRPQPRHRGGIARRATVGVVALPDAGQPVGVEPVLHGEGHAVQHADRAVAGEGLVELVGPTPGGLVVAGDHGVRAR